jgi:predicted ATPase
MKKLNEVESTVPKYKWNPNYSSLRKWKLGAFKSVKNLTEIDLAPLTVIVGANSAGKSSLIQSILLMAQNATKDLRSISAQNKGQLELNSFLVQLGSMKETICDLQPDYVPGTLKSFKNKKFEQFFDLGGDWHVGTEITATVAAKGINLNSQKNSSNFSLNWNIRLRPLNYEINSGISFVEQARVLLTENEIPCQIANLILKKSTNLTDIEQISESKYGKFSLRHQATISPTNYLQEKILDDFLEQVKAKTEIEKQFFGKNDHLLHYQDIEKWDGIHFQSGLPTSGLKKEKLLSYIFENQSWLLLESYGEWRFKQPGRGQEQLFEQSELVLPDPPENQFESVEEAADFLTQSILSKAREIIQQDSIADDLNILSLSRTIEEESFIELNSLPNLEYGDEQKYISNILKIVKRELFSKKAVGKWSEKNILCTPDGKRVIQPVYGTSNLSVVIELWNQYLSDSVVYLGPLRSGPKSSYGLGSGVENGNIPIGESGEFLAKKLFNETDPKRYDVREDGKLVNKLISLEEAISMWYQELCPIPDARDEISVKAPTRQGYEMKIGSRNLANVGFGVSQILPVIALCLNTPPGSLILLEQPELHLNPGMQQKLADFLLDMVKTGRQIIVETHSEYLITRLRRNAATENDDHKYFGIIFAEKDRKNGTTYRTVNVNELGELSEWPKGFFDQVAEDLRVLMKKAAARQPKKSDS